MKNLTSILTVVVGVLAALALWSVRPTPSNVAMAQPASTPPPLRTMHTTGTAVIRVQPDKVTLRLGVETFGLTPRESQAQNARIVEAVLKAIRGEDVPASDIATDYFAIRPEQDNKQPGERSIVGYWTDNAVMVTLRQVDKLSDVLATALEAGATTEDDVTFTTTRLRELRDQARAMAVKAAMEKARDLAGAVSLTTGDVQSIGENSWSYYYGMWNSRGQLSNLQQNVMQVASSPEAPQLDDGEFSLGQIVVQAQVDLTVALK
jgi:uncharacterized protein YggE